MIRTSFLKVYIFEFFSQAIVLVDWLPDLLTIKSSIWFFIPWKIHKYWFIIIFFFDTPLITLLGAWYLLINLEKIIRERDSWILLQYLIILLCLSNFFIANEVEFLLFPRFGTLMICITPAEAKKDISSPYWLYIF